MELKLRTHEEQNFYFVNRILEQTNKIKELEAKVEELKKDFENLRYYASHKLKCEIMGYGQTEEFFDPNTVKCTCGLDKLTQPKKPSIIPKKPNE